MVSGRFSGLCTFGRVQYELCCSYFLACLPHSMAFRGADVKEPLVSTNRLTRSHMVFEEACA